MAAPIKACCPTDPAPNGLPFVYVDSSGYYRNPTNPSSKIQITNFNGSAAVTPTYSKCVHAQSINAIGEPVDPIDCLCCPDDINWFYWQATGKCMPVASFGSALPIAPVPCVTCTCPDPVPFACPVHAPSESGAFAFDFTKRHCDQAVPPHESTVPGCGEATFIPTNYYDPAIIFILKSRNLL